MSSYSSSQTTGALQALEGYDFPDVSHLCDVGGGHRHLLCGFLARYPHLRGTVLERPEVIADRARLWADKLSLSRRCQLTRISTAIPWWTSSLMIFGSRCPRTVLPLIFTLIHQSAHSCLVPACAGLSLA